MRLLSRRELLLAGAALTARAADRPVVSIVRIRNGKIDRAVEEAIDLLGGMRKVARGKERILLKPNLVSPQKNAVTNPEVIRTLARLMQRAGKDVSIGEGSAAAPKFNLVGFETYRTRKREILEPMQQSVFDQLGYTEMAKALRVPLINLHCGEMAEVRVPGGFVYDKVTVHRSLVETDLLCSVPMMKTHGLATVTLGMKNLVGVFPGTVYQSIRGAMHDAGARVEPTGASAVVVDMVRANKLGLVVVDASSAMEGNGPSMGKTFAMDLIIAGTNPVATDMVAANVMGFEPRDVPTLTWANKAGLGPAVLQAVEIRGEPLDKARRPFARPQLMAWNKIRQFWGAKEM